ncbi:lytic transglycosylase domain-containing protein [Sphingobium phenoxybenzoativorans]|uniref:Lytic transglycosylase domain-containing protein n=1 Tax=Sphingobium phenoxybenzoativorans TaxID=1592790 RepID=A0A975K5E6_9SPHN|nr:lytic transglycosylase domain-containing protein [Sphingobium phenoxybenzoativorans]
MAALKTGIAAAVLCLSFPAQADNVARWRAEIAEASARFAIPQAWIEKVISAESGGRTLWQGRPITSRAGAMGLMQLMPETWASLRKIHGLGFDPHDPRDNILAGTAYLRAMYDRFGYPGMFAAYNAGPARYAAHLKTGGALPRETQAYLAQLTDAAATGEAKQATARTIAAAPPALFVLGETANGSPHRDDKIPDKAFKPDPLFVIRYRE